MNDKVRTINIEGIEVQTSLTPVELASLPQKYAELQSNWNSLREYYKRKAEETKDSTALYDKWTKYSSVVDKMNKLESGEK